MQYMRYNKLFHCYLKYKLSWVSFILSGHTRVNASGEPNMFASEVRLHEGSVWRAYRKIYQLCGYTSVSEGGPRFAIGQ